MKLAVVRIRGARKIAPRIRKTLELLRLAQPNHCVLVEDTPQNRGMLEHAKDYVTYGPVEEKTVYSLLYKRGRRGSAPLRESVKEEELKKIAKEVLSGRKPVDYMNPVFRLNPPSKGFRDIKLPYPAGELGKRESMDPLLRRMM
jgi:large subunit ribosomal protein L30